MIFNETYDLINTFKFDYIYSFILNECDLHFTLFLNDNEFNKILITHSFDSLRKINYIYAHELHEKIQNKYITNRIFLYRTKDINIFDNDSNLKLNNIFSFKCKNTDSLKECINNYNIFR